MESSKVISFRADVGTYQKILLECEAKNISKTELVERKIAIANNVKNTKAQLIEKLEHVYDAGIDHPAIARRNLSRVIDFIKKEM